MEMNDRDLLELAARAAGIVERIEENWSEGELPYFHTSNGLWRPLEDDGDALRLANAIGAEIYHGMVVVDTDLHYANITYDHGILESLRRAIVRAAAEIGKKL
jgi:hypothetical protein